MKTKEKKKAGKAGKTGKRSPGKTPAKKRIHERTLNEDEQHNITNVEVDEDIDREIQDHQPNDRDRDVDVEGDEERSSKRRHIEELHDDEAIY